MTLKVELDEDREAALRARAQARGLSDEEYIQQIVDQGLAEADSDLRSVRDIFAESRKRIPPEEFTKLPADGADQHDHYLYGHPKRN